MELDPERYTIAWIAPLEIEARAAACMLDREHVGRFPMQRGDDYVYQAGEICGHNVVIATLPAGQEYGTGSAAALASQVKKFFPNLWFGLLVGVAAGLPRLTGHSPRDIRLGDVLVALSDGDSAGLIAYDLGKETGSDGFQLLKGGYILTMTEPVVRAAIGSIKRRAPKDIHLILPYYDKMKNQEHDSGGGTFADPGQDADRLYEHDELAGSTIRTRTPRPDERRTRIWYGPIGSGDKLMRNASKRNELRDRYNLIGLEMEAAGTMNRIPVGVIRGVCDYGDEHKNEQWQPYAAAMAAAYAKAILAEIGPRGQSCAYYIPFRRNQEFTGRQIQLDQLEGMLFREKRERVAVMGLGGMGKTQIALELAYRVQNMEVQGMTERHSVFWMQAQSTAVFHKSAAEVVQQLNIRCSDEDPKEAFRRHLASNAAGNWLLIIDNLDDADILDGLSGQSGGLLDFFPRNPKGRVLLTTRQASIAVDTAGSAIIKLSSMTIDEAHSLMKILLLDKSLVQNTESIIELLEKLTCLPLTLAQAAAYMNKNGTSIVRYLELCRSADQNMIDLLSRRVSDETHHSQAQGAMVTTWIISFRAIRETDVNAVRYLSFIRWIESKAIPISILPTAGSQIGLEDSIGLLCGYGFLSRREDGETLDMHSLVHLVLRLWLDQEVGYFLITEDMAIKHLQRVFPSAEWENKLVWRQFLPHVLPLLKNVQLRRNTTLHSLGYKIGLCLRVDGRTIEMVNIFERLIIIQEETLAETHPDRLASQHALAGAYQANGQIKKAIEILEHVVAIRKETLTETHPDRLASQHELAGAYQANDQIKKAIEMLEHVVVIKNKLFPKTHSFRLASQHALACAYQANGQIKEAVEMLEYVVAIREKTLAETHPDRLASQHALASAYQDNDQVKEAIKMLEYIVDIREETLAETHPNRLASQHELAGVYRINGQVKKAVEMLEHVVAVKNKTLTETHPDRLVSQHALACAYLANGQVKEAIEMLEYVIAVKNRTLKKTHPDRLVSQHALANAYLANGQIKEAIEMLEHVVAIRKEILAETHPDRLKSQHELISIYRTNSQVKGMLAFKKETLAEAYISKHHFRWWKNKS